MAIWFILLAAIYVIGLFPFAYFRNDDWLIFGNALLHVRNDFSQAFRPTLFYGEREVVWFFRPFFKILPYFFFEAFRYNYSLWLGTLFAFFVLAIYLTFRSLKLLTHSRKKALLFVVLFTASFHLHFGSLIWMGEGMMNIPQLFLFSLNLFLFLKVEKGV